MRDEIKKVVKNEGSVRAFAIKNDIREATMHEFLGNKRDISTKTLAVILEGANMEIRRKLPGKLTQCEADHQV